MTQEFRACNAVWSSVEAYEYVARRLNAYVDMLADDFGDKGLTYRDLVTLKKQLRKLVNETFDAAIANRKYFQQMKKEDKKAERQKAIAEKKRAKILELQEQLKALGF